jgi:hypothetical protein
MANPTTTPPPIRRCRATAAGVSILLILSVNGFARDLVEARIPVKVNVASTVSIHPSTGVAGEGATREVEANTEEMFDILFDADVVSVLHRHQRPRSVAVSYGRGTVSLTLPQTYGSADIALHTLNGKRVMSGKVDAGVEALRANVSAGVYLLSVKGKDGNVFSTKLTHSGGRLNINVAFGGEAFSPLNKSMNSATAGVWTITTVAEGYVTDIREFTPEAGLNQAQNITLSAAQNLCAGFTNGTEREHFGKMKSQFCDERDGQRYVYVTIGSQVWMAENLNYDTADGTGSWCYEDSPDSCAKYGRLYDWNTAMAGMAGSTVDNPSRVQGICPVGWHMPSEVEWDVLITEIGGDMEGYTLMTMSGWYKDGYDYDGYGTD